MGTFVGHAAPGLFLICFSIWWTFAILNRYYQARKSGRRYRSTVAFLCSCGGPGRRYPIESAMKFVCGIVGVIGEVVNAVDGSGRLLYIGNVQHITMYLLFGFSGVVDMMMHFGTPLPPGTDYCYALVAFVGQALLFQFHVHVHSSLAVVMHKLLCFTIWATILAVASEMRWRENVLCALARCFFTGLQGTWFWQIGIYLYILERRKITQRHEVEELVELVAIYYCWHMFAIFFFIVLVALAVSKVHRPRNGDAILVRSDKRRLNFEEENSLLSESDESDEKAENNNHVEAYGLLPMKTEAE